MNQQAPIKQSKRKKPQSAASPTQWDRGADGPANRDRLMEEPATEFDAATGKETPNPNGIRRMRREMWVDKYARKGKLTKEQLAAAANLYFAWAGLPHRDPLAALRDKVDFTNCDDPLAKQFDRRRWFFSLWDNIPDNCKPVIEHVVLNDKSLRSIAGCASARAEARHLERLQRGLDAIS